MIKTLTKIISYICKKKDMKTDTEKMYSLYKKGFSLEKIAKKYNITRQSVFARFKRKKYVLRSKECKPFLIFDGIKFSIDKKGYYRSTSKNRIMLHVYIYESKFGKIPEGYVLHHKDFNKQNNNIDNLQLLTPSEHQKIHIEHLKGSGMNKRVKCIETGEVFESIKKVADLNNQHASNVSKYYIDGGRKLNGFTYEKID